MERPRLEDAELWPEEQERRPLVPEHVLDADGRLRWTWKGPTQTDEGRPIVWGMSDAPVTEPPPDAADHTGTVPAIVVIDEGIATVSSWAHPSRLAEGAPVIVHVAYEDRDE